MALIKCKECGQMISDRATRCPKCGCPVKEDVLAQQENETTNIAPVYYDEEEEGNSHKWLYAIIGILLAALAVGGYFYFDQESKMEKNRQQLATDSIAKDSIAKVEQAREDSIKQAEEKKKQEEQKLIAKKPQLYGQVNDPDGYTNIREAPSTDAPIVRRYDSGDYLYYTPQKNGWSLVYSGVKSSTFMGYMHTSRISKIDPNYSDSYSSDSYYEEGYIVDPVDNYVNVRKGPGVSYAIVGRLDTGTDVYFTRTETNWCKVYDTNYNYLGYVFYDRISGYGR